MVVLYGFADASGPGFRSTFLSPAEIQYRLGPWGRDLSHASSNYRELCNLVNAVDYEHLDQFPVLSQAVQAISAEVIANQGSSLELFMFTDNSVAEGAFFRGTSSNTKLFALILQLRQLELQYSLRLHAIHIASKRMIAQGTDGLSRGDTFEGVLRGHNFLGFVPLQRGALDRYPGILHWIQCWTPSFHVIPLTPADWFVKGHGIVGDSFNTDGVWIPQVSYSSSVIFLWSPPPTAAADALEQLCFSRHKRPHLIHIFIVPCLFTHSFRKRLLKFADFSFYLTPGRRDTVWPTSAFEPLLVSIFLPFLSHAPWTVKGSPDLLALERDLRSLWLMDEDGDEIPLLCHLWSIAQLT